MNIEENGMMGDQKRKDQGDSKDKKDICKCFSNIKNNLTFVYAATDHEAKKKSRRMEEDHRENGEGIVDKERNNDSDIVSDRNGRNGDKRRIDSDKNGRNGDKRRKD